MNKWGTLIARIWFSAFFIMGGLNHLMHSSMLAGYAASKGVPLAQVGVLVSGTMILVGGILFLLGYQAKIAGWLIFLFLLPVAYYMHGFWRVADPMEHMNQYVHFWKNMSLAGAALFFAFNGAGPMSLDARSR